MQLELILPPPRARRNDPETSRDAARSMIGPAAEHANRVLSALRELGEAGAEQIGERCGMEPYAVRKRLPELAAVGLCEPTHMTRITRSGRKERIWRVR